MMSLSRIFYVVPLALISMGTALLHADYATTFSTPPYTVERTVIGTDGWDHRLPTTADVSDSARVVAVRWNGYQPALMLKGANLKNAAPPTTSSKVTLTFDLAFTFPDKGGTGKQFRFGIAGSPAGEIFLDLIEGGGIGYAADGSGKGGTVALPKAEVKVNSFYTFAVQIDFAAKTYDAIITGLKKDGSAFRHEAKGIAFEARGKGNSQGLGTIYIISGGALTVYLGRLEVRSE
jgi:hypothetical protein